MLPGALALRPGAWRGVPPIRQVLPALHLLPLPAYLPLLAHSTHPQRDNFDFFMTIGMGLGNRLTSGPAATDFVVVLSGQARVGRCMLGAAAGVDVVASVSCEQSGAEPDDDVLVLVAGGLHSVLNRVPMPRLSPAVARRPAARARACIRC